MYNLSWDTNKSNNPSDRGTKTRKPWKAVEIHIKLESLGNNWHMHKGTKTNPQDPRWDLESTKVKLLVGQGSDKNNTRVTGLRMKRKKAEYSIKAKTIITFALSFDEFSS